MSIRYVQAGETVAIIGSGSEAACAYQINDRPVLVTLHEHRGGELYVPIGSPAGWGMTLREIGFRRDATGWYVPEELVPPQRPLADALAAHTGVIVLGPLTRQLHTSVGGAALYVEGRCVEQATYTLTHATPTSETSWTLRFQHPGGKAIPGSLSGGTTSVLTALTDRLVHTHGGRHSEIGIHLASEVAW
ncbi:hypothetical protein AB0K18_42560 [Nonomuraea sp. NPDC049421]|uniref:hypothetical protein n=1 Tax=Nonomuraea sp. NPDC049421 TaxID=3155275 RepID=UPI00342DF207